MIQTDGMRGWSYLCPGDLLVFAKKALEASEGDASPKELYCLKEAFKAANEILNEKPSSKDRMKELYKNLIEAIEVEDLTEDMEICSDCGSIPETGACNSCKMD